MYKDPRLQLLHNYYQQEMYKELNAYIHELFDNRTKIEFIKEEEVDETFEKYLISIGTIVLNGTYTFDIPEEQEQEQEQEQE